MIIAWFTQPDESFASYYQYDTATRYFSRIRLQLGRGKKNDPTQEESTFVSYKPDRAVGFSPKKYPVKGDNLSKWSVVDGVLCFENEPLMSNTPKLKYTVYDCSKPSLFVHRGNSVTDAPVLPAGIETKHLMLLANRAFVTKTGTELTPAGPLLDEKKNENIERLIGAIQEHVCKILGVEEFKDVTDAMIRNKLNEQLQAIGGDAVELYAANLRKTLGEVKDGNHLIKEQIEEGFLTPNETFESAFDTLQVAVKNALTASANTDVQQARVKVNDAQQAVSAIIESIDTTEREAVAMQLDASQKALSKAQDGVSEWQEAEEEYQSLSEAKSIEDYEKAIGIGSEEAA